MSLHAFQPSPADEAAAEFEECLVDIHTALEADSQTAKLMQPCIGALYGSMRDTQTAAVFGK